MNYAYSATMPWGKYKGQRLQVIPGSYLFWLLESGEGLSLALRSDIEDELGSRLPQPMPQAVISRIDKQDFVLAWCKRAALACHPDRGGSVTAMKLVNELREVFS
jgi:uncharacterized protein (DUF3820 family)